MPNVRVPRCEGAFRVGVAERCRGRPWQQPVISILALDSESRVVLYTGHTRRAAARRQGAPLQLSSMVGVVHPRSISGGLFCLLFTHCEGWGFWAPGCLTCESEERETWTAESLRAGCVYVAVQFTWRQAGRDFGGTRFRSTPHFVLSGLSWVARAILGGLDFAECTVGPRQTL